jgi:type I restriction enzyme S subunit
LATDEVKCIDDEVPFDLPMGWEWRRLGSLSFDSADGPFGSNLKREHYTSNREVRIIQLSNIGEFGWKDSNVRYTTFAHLTTISRSEAFAGDIIIAKMMPAGRAIICPTLESKYVLSSDAVRFSFSTELEKTYLYYAINSPVFLEQVYGEVQGITRVRTSLQKLRSYLLPIPPINEQKKIVKIIDQLLTLTFNYEKAQDAINELNDHVKPLLKRSILQEAIQGRLVEQCETDEPASVLLEQIRAEKEKRVKAGLLKKSALQDAVIFKGDDNKYYENLNGETIDITDQIPFDIPTSWQWVRLRALCNIATGASFKKEEASVEGANKVRILRGGNILPFRLQLKDNDIFINRELVNDNILLKQNDLVTPAVTSLENICKMARIEQDYGDMTMGGFVFIIRGFYNNEILAHYLQCVFSSPTTIEFVRSITNKSGQAFYNIGKERLSNTLIPIPPFDEMGRITSKIGTLFQSLN